NFLVSLNSCASGSLGRLNAHAKHCVPGAMLGSVSAVTPVLAMAKLAWLFLRAPAAISRATASLVRLGGWSVSAFTPTQCCLDRMQYPTYAQSSNAPAPGMSANVAAISPAVHDSAVVSTSSC